MANVTIPTLIALLAQIGLGVSVFQANPKNRANQCFLLLSVVIGSWLVSLYFAFTATTPGVAQFSIRQASTAGAIYLLMLNLLRLSVRLRQESWSVILSRAHVWLLFTTGVVILCQTPFFLRGANLSSSVGAAPPVAVYGGGLYLYVAFFVVAVVALGIHTAHDLRTSEPAERAELSFILIGGLTGLAFALLLSFVLGLFIEPGELLWLAPFRVLFFSIVVAYGIATRKIMEVGLLFRRAMSYTVLAVYLLSLYAFVWWLVSRALGPVTPTRSDQLAHVAAAVVVAFAMAPARGLSQMLADRLFVGARHLDFRVTMSKAAEILSSVTTLEDLLERFARTIGDAVDSERVLILLSSRNGYTQQYPSLRKQDERPVDFAVDHPIIAQLHKDHQPLVLDELHRVRPTALLERVTEAMDSLRAAVALGIFSREHLAGVVLLGPRLSGRFYGTAEQSALHLLCGQLAVAVENAKLFTEVQNAKIYNEILLQNLTTGVIAASAEGLVTVFNSQAEEITKLAAGELLERPIDLLPAPLRDLLRETLRTDQRQENRDLLLTPSESTVTVRASSSVFHGQGGEMLGALMVLTDITALKRLEEQIRRSDRLASLGTLSAGMAHEIKNPLVSIKTFAQLLPERYKDSDFRETFSNLIGHEIDRIDSLVNQLLRFARPAKPLLNPMHVHEVLEKSLMLVGHRLYQQEIKLARSWNAKVDTIRADPDQLEQVFLNFFLNAMDAMKQGGTLTVATEIRSADEMVTPFNGSNGKTHEVLRVTVRDDGEGISDEHINHVFDPFFTTKDYGTGLGLSVVHGIVQEHGGHIEVESEESRGTAFHILLPLVRFEQEVAAA
ncbi:hypothetical protein BH18VER1_BH18VER1_15850 [soil metagenome]